MSVNSPYVLNGVPLLKPDSTLFNQFIEKAAVDKDFDLFKFINSLDPAAAGPETTLGSGGSAFIVDPYYGLGLVTAGFATRGPFSDYINTASQ